MAFSITGSKYGSLAITTVGTTTLTCSSASFSSTDFALTRLVGMWDSTGATFLGMAWVRAYTSSTVLQLQTPFFDPATGATITQTNGNTILVSKNFAESVTTGLTVTTPDIVTFTDSPTFGGSASNSVCFYDERQNITCPYQMAIGGGLTVFGKLDSYSLNTVSSSCVINWSTLGANSTAFYTSNANSNFAMYGGRFDGNNSPLYHGGYNGTAGYTMVFNTVQCPFDLISPGAGGSWGTYASRSQLVNCISTTTATNAICRRWGDGLQSGGSFNFPNNTNQPISALGSDNSGTYTFSAPAGQRAAVLDFGANQTPGASSTGAPVLFRSGNTITLNVTNLIATNYYQGQGQMSSVTANGNGVTNVYFQDTFSTLQSTTVGNINTTGLTSTNSLYGTSGGSTTWSPSLFYQTVTGFTTTTAAPSAWYYALKAYGKLVTSGTITATTYALVGATAPNVSFQQAVNQSIDTPLVATGITQAVANAYTTLANLDQLYAAMANWATLSAANATYPSIGSMPITYSGNQLNLGIINLVMQTTGSAYSLSTSTNTLTINTTTFAAGTQFTSFTTTGTVTVGSGVTVTAPFTTTAAVTNNGSINAVYTSSAGTSCVVTLVGLIVGSSIYLQPNNSLTSQYIASCAATTQVFYIAPNNGATGSASYKVALYGKISTGFVNFKPQGNFNDTITLMSDTSITQSTVATVSAYTVLSNLDRLYDYAAYWETTSIGIPYTRLVTSTAAQLNLGAINLTTASSGTLWTATGTAPTATALTINVGSTFAAGSTFSKLTTTGSLTTGSGVTITFVYTSSAGTSAFLQLTGVLAPTSTLGQAYVYIANASGTQQAYQTASGTYSFSIAPGATGTWTWKLAQYGKLSTSGTFTPGTGGTFTNLISLSTDAGVTNTAVSSGTPSISTATTLSSLDNIYDYGAYYETTNAGIVYNRVTVQSAAQITLGAATFTYNTAASAVWAISGTAPTATALTVKGATLVNGTTFTSIKTTAAVTISSGTVNQAVVYSSGGNSGIFTITGLTSTAVYLQDNSSTQQDYQSSITGTYTFYTPIGSTGTWTYVAKRSGYGYFRSTITPGTGGLFVSAPTLSQKLNADGSVMYTASTNSLVTVTYATTTEADINIGNGSVPVQNVLDATEISLVTNPGMIWLTVNGECSQFLSSSGNYIFLSTKWRFKALNTSSPNATVSGFAISSDGTPVNSANGNVTFLTSTQASDVAAAVWNAIATSSNTAGSMGAILNDADLQAKLAVALSA